MTIINFVKVECPNNHIFSISFPDSINSWLSPELAQDLVDGKFYNIQCDTCKTEIVIDGEMCVNTTKGIFFIRTDPLEIVREFLYNTEVIDENNQVYPSEEIVKRLQVNQKTGKYTEMPSIEEMLEKVKKKREN